MRDRPREAVAHRRRRRRSRDARTGASATRARLSIRPRLLMVASGAFERAGKPTRGHEQCSAPRRADIARSAGETDGADRFQRIDRRALERATATAAPPHRTALTARSAVALVTTRPRGRESARWVVLENTAWRADAL